jgi:transposase-like protein
MTPTDEEYDEPYYDPEWLRHQYHELGKSTVEIAQERDVDPTTIGNWMKRHNIDRRSLSEAHMTRGIHQDEEWLREQYHEQEKSLYDIADECGVSAPTVFRWMTRHDIDRRSRGR